MKDRQAAVEECASLMQAFAQRTGLEGCGDPGRRYLWTDAHAVCTFLSLARATGDESYRDLAARLVHCVHAELGRHRGDDVRRGWLSGLGEEAGARHPTAAGLRIGKALNERPRSAAYDPVTEWDRDGQYFHYLTKWMHALSRMADETRDHDYLRWAIELAVAAWKGFRVRDRRTGRDYLAWKMRIDLSEPLVPSAGLHDPLDGYVTCRELELRAGSLGPSAVSNELREPIAGLGDMLVSDYPPTDDPLGIGGILFDASRVAQLIDAGQSGHDRLLAMLIASAAAGLGAFSAGGTLELPADRRLAFRELGLSIGLNGCVTIRNTLEHSGGKWPVMAERLADLERHTSLIDRIEGFWLEPKSRSSRTWKEHLDINAVMLATSLLPGQFLLA